MLGISLQCLIVLVLVCAISDTDAQCAAYTPNRVSYNTFDSVFGVTTLNLTSTSGIQCFGVSATSFTTQSICSYEIQAPTGYVIDIQVHTFSTSCCGNGVLSVIDGRGVFGGNYIRTVNSASSDTTITTSSTNYLGIVAVPFAHLIEATGSNVLMTFTVFYHIRQPTATPLSPQTTVPATCSIL